MLNKRLHQDCTDAKDEASARRDLIPKLVVVVDDDETVLVLLKQLLHKVGVRRVETFNSPLRAFEFLRELGYCPDIIICDLVMPEMDGVEFIRALAEFGCTASISVTSAVDRSVIRHVEAAVAQRRLNYIGTIAKPSSVNEIMEKVARWRVQNHQILKTMKIPRAYCPTDIKKGIQNREFLAYFQPQVRFSNRELVGAEVLVRWNHPQDGIVPPIAFIPVAEANDLIDPLTELVVSIALESSNRIRKELERGLRISINVSHQSMKDVTWPDRLKKMIGSAAASENELVVELTESQAMLESAEALESLVRLRLMQIGLSIDDFGTGHSTYEKLSKLPLTELKIDKSFVSGLQNNSTSQAIVRNNINLARELRLETVAEGVENIIEWDFLKLLNADIAQGYYISPPLPLEHFLHWARRWIRENSSGMAE